MFKRIGWSMLGALMASHAHAAEFDFAGQLREGGVGIVIIIGLSILALAVAIERLVRLRARAVIPEGLAGHAQMLWKEGDFAQLQMVADDGSTLGKIIGFMAANRHHDYNFVHTRVSDIASLDLRRHQQRGYALAIVATVAPIVGLLGTVIGMIEAFHVIASADGMGNPALLAGGISKALINTAAGLSVALPALGMHHFLRHRVVSFGLQLEGLIDQLMSEWFEPARAADMRLVASHGH